MSLSTAQKAEKAYKKTVLGVAMTADDKSYYTEPASPQINKSKNIWIDDAKIPLIAPVKVVNQIYDEFGDDATVSGKAGIVQYTEVDLVQIPGAPNSFKTPTVENNIIPFVEINGQYAPVFVDNSTNVVIPVGLNNMEFDAASGTLTFYSGKPAALNSVKAKYWRYVGRTLNSVVDNLTSGTVTTSFPLYNTAPNTSLTGNTFTVTHNKNTSDIDWQLLDNNKFIEPTSLEIVDANTIKVTLETVPVLADNVILKIIQLSGNVGSNVAVPELYVDTYTDLINFVNPPEVIQVLGCNTVNDGGHGVFVLTTSVLASDNGTILDSTVAGKKWIRNYDNKTVNVLWFGAKGDAEYNSSSWSGQDNTIMFITAINTLKNVFIPAGKYIIRKNSLINPEGIVVHSNQNIKGENKQSTIIMLGSVNGTASTYYAGFYLNDKINSTISDLSFRGSHFGYVEETTFSYACAGIVLFGPNIKNITIQNCSFESILGHGIQDNSEISHTIIKNNVANYCSQNGLNINGNFATIINNYGSYNGFGLLEASCGNSLISGNKAEYNLISGIAIGGYNAESTNGHGNNNVILGNICNNNGREGLNITIGVTDSIISNNVIYSNRNFGIVLNETFNKQSNNLVTSNSIFDNGTALEPGTFGIYVNSNGNTITNNNIYNTEAIALTLNKQNYGIVVEGNRNNTKIVNNTYKNIGTYDVYVTGGCTGTVIEELPLTKLFITDGVKILGKKFKSTIAWDNYPIALQETFLNADNASSSKIAILPNATHYPIGQEIIIVDDVGAAGTNNITIKPITGQKINGVVNFNHVISTNFGYLKLLSNGVDGWIQLS